MNLLVVLAGIADPKWPVTKLAISSDGADVATEIPTVLSPFDEAALEVALKLRDAQPNTHITAALLGSPATTALMRHVASFRLDQTLHVDARTWPRWDLHELSSQLRSLIEGIQPQPQLILMGREFGDTDDGTTPACVAAELRRPYVAHIQQIIASNELPNLYRESSDGEETIEVAVPMLASVTNDRRNRLRHPLMKNVMEARRATLPLVAVPGAHPNARLRVTSAARAESGRRAAQGRTLHGASPEVIAALGDFLNSSTPAR